MKFLSILLPFFLCSCITLNLFEDRKPALEEFTVKGAGKSKIALISINGTISNKSAKNLLAAEPGMVQSLISQLRLAARDPAVRGVMIKVNSPGGTVTSSDIMYHEIMRFKEMTKKRVYIMAMDQALSGGYYIALAGDQIYAHPTSMLGSVGVVFMSPKFYGLMDKLGVDFQIYKSGRNKDIGSPFRKATKEENGIFQAMIDSAAERFWGLVEKNRDVSQVDMKTIKTARIFDADTAKRMKMIDGVMYLEKAVEKAARQLDILNSYRVVAYRYSREYNDNLYSDRGVRATNLNPLPKLKTPPSGLLYMDPAFIFTKD